jgi:phosphoesterase RecJ-like protein
LKETGEETWRVSLRSKGPVDVGAIARAAGGGGHRNAAGCSATGPRDHVENTYMSLLAAAVAAARDEHDGSRNAAS